MNKRQKWIDQRKRLESDRYMHNRFGKKRKLRRYLLEVLISVFGFFLKILNRYEQGIHNARNLIINEFDVIFPHLPEKFNGYKILHLTDLHLDAMEGIEDIICKTIARTSYDLCVITGDYRDKTNNGFRHILKPMEQIVKNLKAKDGVLTVMGNHDTWEMAKYIEGMGITLLANETLTLKKETDTIAITGIDDPHWNFSNQAISALNDTNGHFKIALIHTPELYDVAARTGYDLYLCGHTHGGQVCLPGGFPLITNTYTERKYSRGLWQYGNMTGYTNSGCGTAGLPVRFCCNSEIALFRLKRGLAT